MVYQERSNPLHFTPSFLVRFFLAALTLVSLVAGVAHADPATDTGQTGDAQLADDTDPPVVTTNLKDEQVLTGTVPVIETVYEANPQEYAIKITNADGSDLTVNGVPVGVTFNPASGTELRFDWDTTTAENGSYQVVMSAVDQSANSYTLPVKVTVNNQPTPPPYPPITSELTPIPQQAILPPRIPVPPKVSSPVNNSRQTDVLGTKTTDGQVAQRLQNPAVTVPKLSAQPAQVCATFFGVCWYYSVPATVVMSAAAFGVYRLRNRE